MISELSSLLSGMDVKAIRANGHKFSTNLNRNRIRSISAYSSNSIFYFMTIVSDQATPEEVTMTSRFLEKSYASFVVACIGLMPFHRIKADDQASIEEYLSQFHQNMGIKNGNGAAISKAINAASRISESTNTLTELNRAVVEAVKEGVSDEDLAITQDFLQECWDKSRETGFNYVNVVNESIQSLNDKFNKDAIDPVTRTLQEAYRATLHELDTWGFIGEATVDMNLWDDLESMSDEELAEFMNHYDGETIAEIDDDLDDDLEDECPELDSMLESSWEDLYKKAKETMSNSDAVAYANQEFAKIKEKAGQVKELAVQKTKDVGEKLKGAGQVIKSEAEKLDQKAKDAIDRRIIKESSINETQDHQSGALDRQNAQVAADERRHQAEDAANKRTQAANARTAVEQQKAAVAEMKEQRKQTELEMEQQKLAAQQAEAQQEAVGLSLNDRLEMAKMKLQQAKMDGESQERITAAQNAVHNDMVKNQMAANEEPVRQPDGELVDPASQELDAAKTGAEKAMDQAQNRGQNPVASMKPQEQNESIKGQFKDWLTKKKPVDSDDARAFKAQQSINNDLLAASLKNLKPVTEGASMGQAVESIKYSLQSVSADKINGCKNINQLNKLDAKLKKLRSRYVQYLNRYKKKAQDEEKNGNKVIAKLNNSLAGDPKAFMLQYGDYIREINARIEMIRRRKKALAPDIGKPVVNESQFATIGDMELSAIDYCIEAADKQLKASDDDVFDVIVDESLFFKKKNKDESDDKTDTKTTSQSSNNNDTSYTGLSGQFIKELINRNKAPSNDLRGKASPINCAAGNIDEASFAAKHEIKQSDEYQRLMELKKSYKKSKDPKEKVAMLEEAVDLAQKIKIYAHQNIPRDNPAEWIAHTFVEQFRHPLLILINLANAIVDTGNHYTLIQFTKYATRDSFVRRLDELESDLRTALRKAKKQAGMSKGNKLFDESADELLDDEVLFEAADQFFLDEAKQLRNEDLDFISTVKKGTGAIKDIYDIIDKESEKRGQKDRVKYTKEPKTTDPRDDTLYYDHKRPRGNVNVAAAANAQEAKGYTGHRTFDGEVFTNMDMKKANEALPTFAKATIGFIVDETEQVVTRDVLIGVKLVAHVVHAKDLINEIFNTLINHRKFLKFVKWFSGEGTTLGDLLFATKEMKLDANAMRDKSAMRWLPALRRRKRLNNMAVPYVMRDFLPNAGIIITKAECEYLKSEYGLDLLRPDHIETLMRENMLLSFVVIDQSAETVFVTYDGFGGDLQQYSYAALERENGPGTDRMLRELYRSLSR